MTEETTRSKRNMGKLVIPVVLVAALLAAGGLGYMYWQSQQEIQALRESGSAGEEEVAAVVTEVSKLIKLPDGITPTLATVSDASTLKERQPFFADAENGDKVLLYANATDPAQRKAYLYRPSSKQLLNVAPINIGGQVQPQQDEFSMEIRNGTEFEDLEGRMEELLSRVFPNATVPASGPAASQYENSMLVQVNASDELTEKVSQLFNVEVVDLPAGEADPGSVDFLLLLGSSEEAAAEPEGETQASPTASPTTAPAQEEPQE